MIRARKIGITLVASVLIASTAGVPMSVHTCSVMGRMAPFHTCEQKHAPKHANAIRHQTGHGCAVPEDHHTPAVESGDVHGAVARCSESAGDGAATAHCCAPTHSSEHRGDRPVQRSLDAVPCCSQADAAVGVSDAFVIAGHEYSIALAAICCVQSARELVPQWGPVRVEKDASPPGIPPPYILHSALLI